MASFALALDFVLPHEGGESNNPNDKGGKTKYGVTQANLNIFNKKHPELGFPDDVYALTLAQAGFFYASAGYWFFDGVQSQAVASKLFDMAVNMGAHGAVKLAQAILGVTVDGMYGPATEAAINAQNPSRFIDALCKASADHYRAIAVQGGNSVFLKGWLRRAMDVPHE